LLQLQTLFDLCNKKNL